MGIQPARAQPVIIITPIRRVWAWWLRLSWPGAEHVWPVNWFVKRPLKNLRFIHFAHWGLVTRMPPGGGARLRYPYILFQSNFNGDLNAYVDAFAIVIPWRMRLLWQGAFGFPGPAPLGALRTFIGERVDPTLHFYCAYPEASVKMILAALVLQDDLDGLLGDARRMDDAQFAERWQSFLAARGNLL